jgi:hypothetical protein
MRCAITVQELGESLFLYSNLRAAALDGSNPIEVKERRLHQLKAEQAAQQEQNGETATGYPFYVDGCEVDRVPIRGTKYGQFEKLHNER